MEAPVMSRSKTRFTVAIAIVLVALAATMRLLPHPANFAPVAAISIFGGSVLPRRHAIWVPLAAMVASDALIGFYTLPIMLSVWGCYVLIALASSMTLRRFSLWKLALITPAGSVFFSSCRISLYGSGVVCTSAHGQDSFSAMQWQFRFSATHC